MLALRVRVTADPVGQFRSLQSVSLWIQRIDVVHRTTGGGLETERLLTIDSSPRSLEVAQVKGNIVEVGILPVPPGDVLQIRFVLAAAHAQFVHGTEILVTPSAEQSGLKLVPVGEFPFPVETARVTILEAQFDPNRRLNRADGSGLHLKPTIPTVALTEPETLESAAGVVTDEVVALFHHFVSRARIDEILAARGLAVRHGIAEKNYFTLSVPDTMSLLDAINYLAVQPEVDVVLPNTIPIDRRRPNDYDLPDGGAGFLPPWIGQMRGQAAWDLTIGSDAVIVGLVENGFDLDHEDLYLNLFVNEAELPREFTQDVGGRKRLDCNEDGIISMRDLNCLECAVVQAPLDAEQTCRQEFEAARAEACARDALECIPAGTSVITPTVLISSMRNGDSPTGEGGTTFPDDVVGWDFADQDNDPGTGPSSAVEARHGMEMAGVIGAVTDNRRGVAGVAWRVRIVPQRAKNTSEGLEAIHYATKLGAKVVNYSRGDTYLAGADPGLSYNGPPCQFSPNGTDRGADFVNAKRDARTREWSTVLDLSRTMLSVSAPNCKLDLNLDAGSPVLDWPSQWAHLSVLTSAPSSGQNATGDIIAIRTGGGPGLTLKVTSPPPGGGPGFVGGADATESTSYSAAYVSGVAALTFSRFPDASGPCMRGWMAAQGFLFADTIVGGLDGGLPCQ